ncbi:MAG: hypothetical protein CL610_09360 [Anaerolineaceae bacterium]|nr:hypothetical protein [Anaerolineaceae bacterium]
MKTMLTLCLLLLIIAAPLAAQTSSHEVAEQANALYAAGDYEGAKDLYETLISNGVAQSAVYYNLGHAYLRLDDLGRGLLNYRRAHSLTPRDDEIRTALARARASRVDIEGDETFPTDSLAALTASLLTIHELNWLVLGLWVVFFGLGSIYVIQRSPVARGMLVAVGAVLLFTLMLWLSRLHSSSFRPPAVVLAPVTPVMSGPGEAYLQIYELHAAAEIHMLSEQGSWGHFALPSGQEGWIQLQAVEKV